MKTVLKILGYTILAAMLLLGAGVSYIYFKGVPSYPYDVPDAIAQLNVTKDSATVARGAKIASLLCKECHRDFETGKMTGHIMTDMPKEFGTIASLNITQDPDHGIGAWTDSEIYYYLRRSTQRRTLQPDHGRLQPHGRRRHQIRHRLAALKRSVAGAGCPGVPAKPV